MCGGSFFGMGGMPSNYTTLPETVTPNTKKTTSTHGYSAASRYKVAAHVYVHR